MKKHEIFTVEVNNEWLIIWTKFWIIFTQNKNGISIWVHNCCGDCRCSWSFRYWSRCCGWCSRCWCRSCSCCRSWSCGCSFSRCGCLRREATSWLVLSLYHYKIQVHSYCLCNKKGTIINGNITWHLNSLRHLVSQEISLPQELIHCTRDDPVSPEETLQNRF